MDAVITWVDGSDSSHVAKRNAYLGREKKDLIRSIPAGTASTRFSDNGELKYCIASLRKFAPWIRRIFLVTDSQCPSFLRSDRDRLDWGVVVVDHKDIFRGFEWALPTFNSITIETALHRIDGLADQYLYFNDDVILCRPVGPADFFQDRRVVLRGAWRDMPVYGTARLALSAGLNIAFKRLFGINRAMSVLQQIVAARLAGFKDEFFWSPHVPHPVVRSGLEDFFAENPSAFAENIGHRFRNTSQFVPTSLSNHIQIAKGNVEFRDPDDALMICFNRDLGRVLERKLADLEQGRSTFLCLQSFDQACAAHRDRVEAALTRIIGAAI